MRIIALCFAASGLLISGSVLAQDNPAPADSTPPPASAPADTAAAPAPADAGTLPPATVDASAPPADTALGDPLEGIRDIDYIGILGNGIRPDRRRGLDLGNETKSGAGGSVLFGRHFGDGFGWEANYTASTVQTDAIGAGNLYLHNLGGDLTYSFGDRQHLTPFLLVGGGGEYDDVHPRKAGGVSGYADGGVGLVSGTFWHNRIRLRAEVRASHDFIHTPEHVGYGYTDYRAGLGIEIPFYELKPVAPIVVHEEQTKVVEIPWGLRDDDGDGVINEKDKCPNTPPNTRVDGDGCPIPKVVRLEGVTFAFNKDHLRPDAQTILTWVVGIMQKYPDMQVELAGYTDSIGGAAYNLKLSERRAEAVKAYLVEKGIDAGHIQAKGYGKDNPVASNDTDEGRERNRRVELHILN